MIDMCRSRFFFNTISDTPDGRALVAIGCTEGVWIGFRHDPKCRYQDCVARLFSQHFAFSNPSSSSLENGYTMRDAGRFWYLLGSCRQGPFRLSHRGLGTIDTSWSPYITSSPEIEWYERRSLLQCWDASGPNPHNLHEEEISMSLVL